MLGVKYLIFFMDFLSASEGMNTKIQNKGLLQAVNDYCDSSELNQAATQEYRQQVYRYCNEQQQAGEEIELKRLSNELPALESRILLNLLNKMAINWQKVFHQIVRLSNN